MKKNIVIVGGYGAVGSQISSGLASHFPGRIIVAGRSLDKARQLAVKLGQNVIPYRLDVAGDVDVNLLNEAVLVIMCIDQTDTRFVEHCINHGVNYIDITANQLLLEKMELLDDHAKKNKVSVVLSVGLAPGITNLLVRHGLNCFPKSDAVAISVLLGLAEQHGDAAYRWTFDNLHTSYAVTDGEKTRNVKSFSVPKITELMGKRRFYTFNFSDQHTLLKTTPVQKILTRMAFDSQWITNGMALLRKTGLTALFRYKSIQNVLIPLFKKAAIGSDVFGVKAEVFELQKQTYTCSVTGYGEGNVTACCAIETALYVSDCEVPFGVVHSHQMIQDIPRFLNELKKYDSRIQVNL